MNEWQPIETAPKDQNNDVFFDGEQYRVYSPCQWSKEGEISQDGFWIWWQAEPEWLVEVKPTHWQPLPLPPKDGE